MKSTSIKLFLIAIMAMVTISASAQDNGKQRMSREKFAETQARHISQQLALDDKTSNKFIETYTQCQREVWALGPRLRGSKGRTVQPKTDAESEQAIKQRFDRSQKLLDIKQKYYKEYSKFLTQNQIQRVYELERQMRNKLARHGQKRGTRR